MRLFWFQFKEISFAYEVLSTADKRELYDRHGLQGLKEGGGPGGGMLLAYLILFRCILCNRNLI